MAPVGQKINLRRRLLATLKILTVDLAELTGPEAPTRSQVSKGGQFSRPNLVVTERKRRSTLRPIRLAYKYIQHEHHTYAGIAPVLAIDAGPGYERDTTLSKLKAIFGGPNLVDECNMLIARVKKKSETILVILLGRLIVSTPTQLPGF